MKEKVRKILEFYGPDAQIRQCIEEMAELTQALCKYERVRGNGQPTTMTEEECYNNIVEEIADVQVMLEQMKMYFLCSTQVEKIMEQKVERQLERMGNA